MHNDPTETTMPSQTMPPHDPSHDNYAAMLNDAQTVAAENEAFFQLAHRLQIDPTAPIKHACTTRVFVTNVMARLEESHALLQQLAHRGEAQ